jgi:hypothetical protein
MLGLGEEGQEADSHRVCCDRSWREEEGHGSCWFDRARAEAERTDLVEDSELEVDPLIEG